MVFHGDASTISEPLRHRGGASEAGVKQRQGRDVKRRPAISGWLLGGMVLLFADFAPTASAGVTAAGQIKVNTAITRAHQLHRLGVNTDIVVPARALGEHSRGGEVSGSMTMAAACMITFLVGIIAFAVLRVRRVRAGMAAKEEAFASSV